MQERYSVELLEFLQRYWHIFGSGYKAKAIRGDLL